MTISAFITITNPERRGDLYKECIKSALGFCDELVIVDGGFEHQPRIVSRGSPNIVEVGTSLGTLGSSDGSIEWIRSLSDDRIKIVHKQWGHEFSWPLIGESFHFGYENCTSDWVVHLDCDFIINEKDYGNIRRAFEQNNNQIALSFWKHQYILPDRYNLKSRLVIAVNKGKYGGKLSFSSGGDLCQPAIGGQYIRPEDVPEARVAFNCYEKILKSKSQIAEDQGRMERAWFRRFSYYQMGSDGTDESAYDRWITAQKGKFAKPQRHIALEEHPAVMIDAIRNLKPEQFGYSGFAELGENDYVRASR